MEIINICIIATALIIVWVVYILFYLGDAKHLEGFWEADPVFCHEADIESMSMFIDKESGESFLSVDNIQVPIKVVNPILSKPYFTSGDSRITMHKKLNGNKLVLLNTENKTLMGTLYKNHFLTEILL